VSREVAVRFGVGAAALGLVLAACTDDAAAPVTADCTQQIRFEGVIYDGWGHTAQEPATRLGTADKAECHDVGPSAAGSVFPDNPRQVAVWSFEGYAPEEVVGVRLDRDSYVVFVNASAPRHRAEAIKREFVDAN
jgi:hypothetical protein